MKKINKIFITLASIVSISSLPIVAASCDVEKTEEGTGANSDTKDQEDQTLSKRPKGTNSSKGPKQTLQKTKRNKPSKGPKENSPKDQKEQTPQKDQKNKPKKPKGQTQKDQKPNSSKKPKDKQKDTNKLLKNKRTPKGKEQTPPKGPEKYKKI
ncbi:variable surface lipoprotein [Mycoplasmopsis bovis]|nr:variable surface lipoprotein [Mycoplasmopsis bovis]QQH24353.1 variable surface lipoprotein [Mycoplasmopsis bovis]